MNIMQRISAVLAFRTIPTTVLIVAIYVVLSSLVIFSDELPSVPKTQNGLSVVEAYADLHEIASRPHPYNSHANDLVRSYLSERMFNITTGHEYAHFISDTISNGSWSTPNGVYFEGNNLLLKIDGTEHASKKNGSSDGVLFSAHFDSVSTAPGATDDGMAVVTLLQLMSYFVKNRPKKTVVFNINNGEEDWLNGAHAFLEHPWSKLVDTFLNLEGASSGGRPTLFRATSTAPVLAFLSENVAHPSGNVLSSDAFSRGVIRSGTDYEVYVGTKGKMTGLDFAFYKERSRYHTKYDSIPYTLGLESALWNMMETSLGAGVALANQDKTHERDSGLPVYFDLFNSFFIVFSLSTLFIIDVVLLSVGPIVLILLVICEAVIQHNRRGEGLAPSILWQWFTERHWIKGIWRWSKFWLALVISIGLQALLAFAYIQINPFIAYSSPPLVSFLCLAYLSLVLVLNLPIGAAHGKTLPEQQKHTVLLQSYIFTWILLLLSTIAVEKANMGGSYWITAWNAVLLLGSVMGCLEGIFGAYGTGVSAQIRVTNGSDHQNSNVQHNNVEDGEEPEPTENTPLIAQQEASRAENEQPKEEGGAILWWLIQALVVIPLPVALIGPIIVLIMGAIPQTLSDGNSIITVYGATSLLALLFVLPIAPFSFKLSRYLTSLVALTFILSTIYHLLAFPFSQESPLKVYFQQHVQLDFANQTIGKPITSLAGVSAYLNRDIVSRLPSAQNVVVCAPDVQRVGLQTCSWQTDLVPSPGGVTAQPFEWISFNTTRLDKYHVRISIQGRNTRNCRLYFDTGAISEYIVHGSGDTGMQEGYEVRKEGIKEVRLWARDWDKKFVVDVKQVAVNSTDNTLTGRAACEWTEYESASVGIDLGPKVDFRSGKIPALEEVLKFLPSWVTVTKQADGLLEVWGNFSV